MATAEAIGAQQRFVLYGVPWETYLALREVPENHHVRMTFSEGVLEMMSPSKLHEQIGYLVGRLIDVWTDEMDIEVQSCRTMTFQRADLEKGFEPDNCYYVKNEPLVWRKTDLDLTVDPPPDLAVEIDVSRSSASKMPLYAAFGVPEVWQFDGEHLRVHELGSDGGYVQRESSVGLPQLPIAEVERVLRQVGLAHETALVRGFRQWVRANFVPGT